ncbi:MAG: type II toxin-antitoxin system RelE/ParE family toxin [Planctomycetota bacterium]
MAQRIDVHPGAQSEITGALQHYEENNLSVAEDLDKRIDAAVQLIALKPETWPAYIHGTRRYILRRFPFSLVYRESGGVIQIIALAHHRRKPGYWKKRAG